MKKKFLLVIVSLVTMVGLASAYSRNWSVSTPIDHTLNREWPEWIRRTKTDIAERLASIFYGFTAGETDTGVKALPFLDQSSDPSTISNQIQLYGKAVGGKTEIFWKDEDGTAVQLTNAGTLNITEAAQQVPAGSVSAYAGSSTPSGWLLCDGSAVSRTTYAALFTAIGITYGAGDSSTTFNIPDLRDRFPLGKGTTFTSLATTGGATTKNLAHTHSVPYQGYGVNYPQSANDGTLVTRADNSGNATTSPTSGSGGSASQDIMNPYIVLNWIIKT